MIRLRGACYAIAVGLAFVASAELAARLDDRLRSDIPFMASPSYMQDLTVRDSLGTHGRPYGRFEKWKLNNAGFRGPNITPFAQPGCTRIMALGASETFGYYESPGKEYVAQLSDSIQTAGCYEVVNAAIVGLTVPTMTQLWTNWASRFHPQIVIVYPSPAFYLAADAPDYPSSASHSNTPSSRSRSQFRSRMIARAKERFEVPEFLQRIRVQRAIEKQIHGKPAGWFFNRIPTERLRLFETHLDSLVSAIRSKGATPVLVTHAMRFSFPPVPQDSALLQSWRQFSPRATAGTMLAFDTASARVVRQVAVRQNVPLIDAAAALTGHREWFADFVHFTDAGAARMAHVLADGLRTAGLVRPRE